jgi:hypothetical protein
MSSRACWRPCIEAAARAPEVPVPPSSGTLRAQQQQHRCARTCTTCTLLRQPAGAHCQARKCLACVPLAGLARGGRHRLRACVACLLPSCPERLLLSRPRQYRMLEPVKLRAKPIQLHSGRRTTSPPGTLVDRRQNALHLALETLGGTVHSARPRLPAKPVSSASEYRYDTARLGPT